MRGMALWRGGEWSVLRVMACASGCLGMQGNQPGGHACISTVGLQPRLLSVSSFGLR